jgi:hypothetical protein
MAYQEISVMSNNRNRDQRDQDMRRGDQNDDTRRANTQQSDFDMERGARGGNNRRSGNMSMPGTQNRSRKKK